MGRVLIIVGLVIAGIGLLISMGLPLGRLPGDLSWRRGNATFHFPLATSIVLSILLTLLFALFRR
jgi:uncharacterized protein HemY